MKKTTIFAMFGALLLISCGHGIHYSDGQRAGYVLKFSRGGLICPTWEGTMNLAGTGQNSLVEFNFTVDPDKPKVIELLQDAVVSGKRVQVEYVDTRLYGLCTGDTGYFIQKAAYTDPE